MTNELEKQFFDTFGIEPIEGLEWECYSPDHCFKTTCVCPENCTKCDYFGKEMVYPQITDRILLELICILSQSYPLNYEGWSFNTAQELKETILSDFIHEFEKDLYLDKENIKHQLRTLLRMKDEIKTIKTSL